MEGLRIYFATPEVDRILIGRAGTLGIPLMLAGGEDVSFHRADGRLLPFVFGLERYGKLAL